MQQLYFDSAESTVVLNVIKFLCLEDDGKRRRKISDFVIYETVSYLKLCHSYLFALSCTLILQQI